MSSTWTGAGHLTRLSVRRDRVLVALSTLVLVGVAYASAAATRSLYPGVADRVAAADAINASPAIVALYGPIEDPRSLGEVSMTKMTVLYAVFVTVLLVVVVRRHTRAEEESGRAELLGGTAVGRNAQLASAEAGGVGVSLLVGLLAALATLAGGLPLAGSLAFGASWAGTGLVATGLTVLTCQLSASARTCASVTAAVVGALFVLRAVGDTTAGWLSWLSPFGWNTQLHAWSGTRWWVLGLYVVLAGVLAAGAHLLRGRRDLGAGLLAARPGPAHGAPRLGDPVRLAVRLHTSTALTWTAGVAVTGVVLGAVAPHLGSMLDSPGARQMMQRLGGTGALADTLRAAELSVVAVLVTCFALAVVAHGGTDEHDGRTEQVLATATSRLRAYLATLVEALLGSTWLLLVTGVAVGIGFGAAGGGHASVFARTVAAALAQAPAVWLVTALAVAAYAVRSRWSGAGWVLLVLFLTLGQLGELLRLPRVLVDLSPYVHAPKMPVEPFAPAPALTMTVLAVVLLVAGSVAYRRRDIG